MKNLLSSILLIVMFASAPAFAQTRPNVILIYTDDLGYGDLSSYGATSLKTPNLDRLAREGVRLTDTYSNGPVCTPTRAGFVTGRYQQRVGLEWTLLPTDKEAGLPAAETSAARMLKANGYRTAALLRRSSEQWEKEVDGIRPNLLDQVRKP